MTIRGVKPNCCLIQSIAERRQMLRAKQGLNEAYKRYMILSEKAKHIEL